MEEFVTLDNFLKFFSIFIFSEIALTINEKLQLKAVFQVAIFY